VSVGEASFGSKTELIVTGRGRPVFTRNQTCCSNFGRPIRVRLGRKPDVRDKPALPAITAIVV
jgi:hypothetical protein